MKVIKKVTHYFPKLPPKVNRGSLVLHFFLSTFPEVLEVPFLKNLWTETICQSKLMNTNTSVSLATLLICLRFSLLWHHNVNQCTAWGKVFHELDMFMFLLSYYRNLRIRHVHKEACFFLPKRLRFLRLSLSDLKMPPNW